MQCEFSLLCSEKSICIYLQTSECKNSKIFVFFSLIWMSVFDQENSDNFYHFRAVVKIIRKFLLCIHRRSLLNAMPSLLDPVEMLWHLLILSQLVTILTLNITSGAYYIPACSLLHFLHSKTSWMIRNTLSI